MFDKEDSPLAPGIVLDEEYITQIKEDRLARMLAGEVVEAEERWITYDDEQTEIIVELGDFVYSKLIEELVDELRAKSTAVASVPRKKQSL